MMKSKLLRVNTNTIIISLILMSLVIFQTHGANDTPSADAVAGSPTIFYSPGVDVSSGTREASIDLTGIETSLTGVTLSLDGTKLFVIGGSLDNIYEYNLSTPFDLSTATSGTVFDISNESTNPTGMAFSSDGFDLYVSDNLSDVIFQYQLSVAYDLSTASYSGLSLDVSTEEATVSDIFLAPDDATIFIIGTSSDAVYEYEMSIPGEVNTAAYTGVTLNVSTTTPTPNGIFFNGDGSRMFTVGSTRDRVYTYFLTTPYDISTAELGRTTLSVVGDDTSPQSVAISSDGTRLYIAGDTNDDIISYDLTTNAFFETGENAGAVAGQMIISICGDSFNGAGTALTEGTDYTIDNLPSGLTPVLTVASDARSAFLILDGAAIAHDQSDDLENIVITFANSALVSGDAGGVANATAANTNLRIDFNQDLTQEVLLASPVKITTATANGTFDLTTIETSVSGLTFSTDGSKMYVVGSTLDNIYEFDLATNFDVTSAVASIQKSIAFEDGTVSDVILNPSGTRMYILGTSSDRVWELIVPDPFELSSAYFSGATLDVSGEESSPGGMRWNADGTSLYVIGSTTDRVFRYDLTSPYDLSTATYSGISISIASEEASPNAIEFNANGTKMFVLGQSSDRIFSYDLSVGFDINTAVNTGVSFSVAGFDTAPTGMYINPEGTQLMVIGSTNDDVFGFDLSSNAFVEKGANDGTVEGQLILSLVGDTFSNPSGTLADATDFTTTLSSGLTPSISVSVDGQSAVLTVTGQADAHDDADVSNIQLTFENSAFAGGDASVITNATAAISNLNLDFAADIATTIDYSTEILVSAAVPTSSVDFATADANLTGITFNNDGSKMFLIGISTDNIFEYDLSTAYDVSTAVPGDQLSVLFEETNAQAIEFNPSGTRMYMLGTASDAIHEYLLDVPFELSSASYSGEVLELSGEEFTPTALSISPDGMHVFVVGSTSDAVHQYDLTEGFDFSTASASVGNISVAGQESAPTMLHMNASGTRMYMGGTTGDRLYTYELTTPFDIVSAVNTDVLYYFLAEDSAPNGVFIDASGTRMFMVGTTNDNVNTYSLPDYGFTENGANNGGLIGELNLQLNGGDQFNNPGMSLIAGTDYSVSNLPSGLVPDLAVSSDGFSARLTVTGSTANHDNTDDISSLTFSFLSSAFVDVATSSAVNTASNLGIDFVEDIPASLDFALDTDIAAFKPLDTLDVSAEDNNATALTFSSDGTKLYIIGDTNDDIFEYTLGSPYDLSDVTAINQLDIGFNDTSPTGFVFNPSGSRMYTIGTSSDEVREFILSTPFDITTAAFSGVTLSVSSEELSPTGIAIHPDGVSLFILGNINDRIFEYAMTEPFELSTASYTNNNVSIVSQENSPTGMTFNKNGRKMFVVGTTTDRIFTYDLSAPYYISTEE